MDNGSPATKVPAQAQDKTLNSAAARGPMRIRSLDVLRGVGVLGMLAVHIQLFAFPSLARWNPTAYGDLGVLNWWVWLATSEPSDGKFFSILPLLPRPSLLLHPAPCPRPPPAAP